MVRDIFFFNQTTEIRQAVPPPKCICWTYREQGCSSPRNFFWTFPVYWAISPILSRFASLKPERRKSKRSWYENKIRPTGENRRVKKKIFILYCSLQYSTLQYYRLQVRQIISLNTSDKQAYLQCLIHGIWQNTCRLRRINDCPVPFKCSN